jgi:hypothetical protein
VNYDKGTIFNLTMEKLTRGSEVEYKGTIYTGMVIVERSIDE